MVGPDIPAFTEIILSVKGTGMKSKNLARCGLGKQ